MNQPEPTCADPRGCHNVVPCPSPCGTDLLAEIDAQAKARELAHQEQFNALAAKARELQYRGRARHRAAVLCEAADAIDARQDQLDGEIRTEYGALDRDTEIEGAATRSMAALLRRMAEEA
ncbi:hypothetical protein [Streptomyces sp. NPDC056549]|uniref:hypothetical protein n=1 Tax=Streptomyces sp. NPDC056549 TaxID=3345864 RepID=UPI00368E717E